MADQSEVEAIDRKRISFSLDGSVSSSVVGQAAREFAMDAGFGSERSERLGVVVAELIRESRTREAVDGDDSMTIELGFDGSVLRCVMRDQRIPLTRAEVDAAPVHRLTALRFVDRLDIGFSAPVGNHAIIEMRIENYAAVYLGLPEDEDVELDPNDILDELEFRVMTTDDAELLVRCLYRCYGYTYPDSDLYLESHIVHLLESGKMHSTIALAPDGEIVGHSAAVFEEEGQRYPEFGKLVVDPRFRSHKVPSRMQAVEETIEFVASLPGYYGRCVTNHPISQKLGVNVGGTETGLLLGITPADVTMTGGLSGDQAGRLSLMFLVHLFGESRSATLSVPENLVAILQQLSDRLGIERSFDPSPHVGNSATDLSFSINHSFGVGSFSIRHIGEDIATAVAARLAEVAGAKIDFVQLELDANDPSASWAIGTLERLGFFFGAFLPDFTDRGDRIVLQRVTPGTVNIDGIVCARAEGEELRDMTLGEWKRVNDALLGLTPTN